MTGEAVLGGLPLHKATDVEGVTMSWYHQDGAKKDSLQNNKNAL